MTTRGRSRSTLLALTLFGSACAPQPQAPFVALPATAFRVEWQPVLLPTHLRPGERRAVDVTVRNGSVVAWPANGQRAPYAVRLGHRWIRGSDAAVVAAYGNTRSDLPHAVPPGGRITVSVVVVAPTVPGDYVLQFDLNQAGVAWFADRGAAKKLVLVKVG